VNVRATCHWLNEGRITVFWLVVTFALFFAILFACVAMVVDAYR
jgi:hypothetical protein